MPMSETVLCLKMKNQCVHICITDIPYIVRFFRFEEKKNQKKKFEFEKLMVEVVVSKGRKCILRKATCVKLILHSVYWNCVFVILHL